MITVTYYKNVIELSYCADGPHMVTKYFADDSIFRLTPLTMRKMTPSLAIVRTAISNLVTILNFPLLSILLTSA